MTTRSTLADVAQLNDAILISHLSLAVAEAARRPHLARALKELLGDALHEMMLEELGRTPGGLNAIDCPETLSDTQVNPTIAGK